jgi:alpha-mannosidase
MAVLTQTYRIGHSELVQEIRLYAGSRRLEFDNRLSWRETSAMLRVSFPVAVHAEEAAYEIQFGHIFRPTHRNTTWDLAKDEVPCQKWVDLSQRDYGAALLNDSKYGSKVKDGVIELTLLRSVPYPGPRLVEDSQVQAGQPHHAYTDQAEHSFRYAFLPHRGDLVAGGVVRSAYEFNFPLRAQETTPAAGSLSGAHALIQLDAAEIVVEAVKQAEDSPAIIMRLYESAHSGVTTSLRFGFPVQSVEEVNLMEETLAPLPFNEGAVQLTFQPFEIKSLKITRA